MFFDKQDLNQIADYEKFLQTVWSLSNLFSDSEVPYLYYRIAEKIFCRAFNAEDLSRSDVSVDAKKEKVWIWLKTFLIWNKNTFQKVAEFNADKKLYDTLPLRNKINKIAELRNERILLTQRIFWLESSIYHCVLRDVNKMLVYEESLDLIDVANITWVRDKWSSIIFQDGKNEYSFLVSKSTLQKRFKTEKFLKWFDVKIIKDPLSELSKIFWKNWAIELWNSSNIKETVYLPLYGKDKKVYGGSGLNQWNANGRPRDFNEIYVPIPILIHQKFPNFFPSRDTSFDIKLPNGEKLNVKLCQAGSKALMSNPNKALGKWLLRDVLNLEEGELLTYERLQLLGIDSVRIDKTASGEYEINFSEMWSYEDFLEKLTV